MARWLENTPARANKLMVGAAARQTISLTIYLG
jgi:hypothetical protein